MDVVKNIEDAKKILSEGGNIIKVRDDRELILVDKDGKWVNVVNRDWGLEDGAIFCVTRSMITKITNVVPMF